jgi:hypothetical protein
MRRRDLLRVAGMVPAATLTEWLAACDPDPDPASTDGVATGDGPPDLLVVRTDAGLALVDADAGRIVAGPRPGVNDVSGCAYVTSAAGARTTVDVTRSTGRRLFQSEVDGSWQVRAISPDGRLVALADPAGSTGYLPQGRTGTTIVVADEQGERRRYPLPGCVEPEAFSAGGDYLYVLDYLPPEAPDRYRVRALDLGTGTFEALRTKDKQLVPPGAEEEMHGEGRQAVYVPGQQFLFTPYTHQPDHEHTRDLIAGRDNALHAFVHSLSLGAGFAYCIDLPTPFGDGVAEGHVIAVAPNGTDPIVVDTTSGALAELDAVGLQIRRVAAIPPTRQEGPASAVLNGLLFLGRGRTVRRLRPEGYAVLDELPMANPVRGLGLSVNRRRLWVGQEAGVVAFDADSGQRLATVPVPGLVSVESVGAKS